MSNSERKKKKEKEIMERGPRGTAVGTKNYQGGRGSKIKEGCRSLDGVYGAPYPGSEITWDERKRKGKMSQVRVQLVSRSEDGGGSRVGRTGFTEYHAQSQKYQGEMELEEGYWMQGSVQGSGREIARQE